MRTGIVSLGALGIVAALACACGGPSTGDRRGIDLPPRSMAGASQDDDADPGAAEGDGTLVPGNDGESTTPANDSETPPAEQTYCDAAQTIPGVILVEDALAADTAKFSPAAGFPSTSWSFANQSYVQSRLVNASDATFFAGDAQVGDVDIEVSAASTDVTSTISPRLRQMFVLVGATVTGGTLDAIGCGVEVVQGMSPEQRTSVVKLSGNADAVATTAIDRAPRNVLKEGEPFSIRAKLQDGTLTCTVSQGADVVTTATATGLTNVKGSIGFFTRQTKAAFKNVKVCKLQKPVVPTK
jgi:hypothetical protein